jgi:hypothetical protein
VRARARARMRDAEYGNDGERERERGELLHTNATLARGRRLSQSLQCRAVTTRAAVLWHGGAAGSSLAPQASGIDY